MKERYVRALYGLAGALALSACAHPGAALLPFASTTRSPSTFVQTGRVFEYTLPSFVSNVSALANGPADTVWFDCTTKPMRSLGVWYLCDMDAAGTIGVGGVAPPPAPTPPPGYFISGRSYFTTGTIASAGGYIWYEGIARYDTTYCGSLCRSGPTLARAYLIRRGTSTTTLFATQTAFRTAILASDGRIWMPADGAVSTMLPSAATPPVATTMLPAGYDALWITCRYQPCSPLDPYVYVLAIDPSTPSSTPQVFRIAGNGQIVRTFALPVGSNPQVITGGPDANLWITENFATGASKIVRIQPTTGLIAQFQVSASNAGLAAITKDADGALWFTESAVNRVGRITTAGAITTPFSVPTASSAPNGIIQCPVAVCGAHAGVWFAETAANKLARYDFP